MAGINAGHLVPALAACTPQADAMRGSGLAAPRGRSPVAGECRRVGEVARELLIRWGELPMDMTLFWWGLTGCLVLYAVAAVRAIVHSFLVVRRLVHKEKAHFSLWIVLPFVLMFDRLWTEVAFSAISLIEYGQLRPDFLTRFTITIEYLQLMSWIKFMAGAGPLIIPTLYSLLSRDRRIVFYLYSLACLFCLPAYYANQGGMLVQMGAMYGYDRLVVSGDVSECTRSLMASLNFVQMSRVPDNLMEDVFRANLPQFQYWLNAAANSLTFDVFESFHCPMTEMTTVREVDAYVPGFVFKTFFSLVAVGVILSPFKYRIRRFFRRTDD